MNLVRSNKGKPSERMGRKATGLNQCKAATDMVAGLPGKDLIRTVKSSTASYPDCSDPNDNNRQKVPPMFTQHSSPQNGKSLANNACLQSLLVVVVLLTFAFPSPTLATITKELHFEWLCDTTSTNLAGYKIFQDGILLVTITNSATLSLDYTVDLEEGRYTLFTMKSFDTYGNESPLSEPYSIGVALGGNILPMPRIDVSSSSGVAPHVVEFSAAESTDSDGTIISYEWDFGDGGTSTEVSTNHAYMTAGTFTTTLTVIDNFDGVATAQKTIDISTPVSGTPPTVYFTSTETSGNAPLAVNFDGSSSSDDGVIISYLWNFGDGTTANGATVSHVFSNVGSYKVELTVTDDNNDQASYEKEITVIYPLVDVNHDQDTNLTDLILILQVLSGKSSSLPVYNDVDLNGDGRIGIEEAIYCLQKVVN